MLRGMLLAGAEASKRNAQAGAGKAAPVVGGTPAGARGWGPGAELRNEPNLAGRGPGDWQEGFLKNGPNFGVCGFVINKLAGRVGRDRMAWYGRLGDTEKNPPLTD